MSGKFSWIPLNFLVIQSIQRRFPAPLKNFEAHKHCVLHWQAGPSGESDGFLSKNMSADTGIDSQKNKQFL